MPTLVFEGNDNSEVSKNKEVIYFPVVHGPPEFYFWAPFYKLQVRKPYPYYQAHLPFNIYCALDLNCMSNIMAGFEDSEVFKAGFFHFERNRHVTMIVQDGKCQRRVLKGCEYTEVGTYLL